MNGELLILFVILLLGLILCSFLGGKGCIEGLENNTSSQTFTGPNGATAQIQTDSNGQSSLVVTNSNGVSSTYSSSNSNSTTYTGPNGSTAQIMTGMNGTNSLIVTNSDGTIHTYTINEVSGSTSTNNTTNSSSTSSTSNTNSSNSSNSSNYDNYNHFNGTSYPTIFYGPNGGTARVIQLPNNNTIVTTNKNGTTEIYYIDKNATDPSISTYYGPNGGSAKIITDSNGNQAVEITTPNGNKIIYTSQNIYSTTSQDDTINQYDPSTISTGSDYNTVYTNSFTGPYGGQANVITGPGGNTYATYDSSAYLNSLPPGIPKSQIPAGDEDLYILKSQVVPPVCPKCPDPIVQCPDNFDATKCPPCPPCARCPEPAFDCKKVPNYSAFNQNYLPVPVLNDFSTFGM